MLPVQLIKSIENPTSPIPTCGKRKRSQVSDPESGSETRFPNPQPEDQLTPQKRTKAKTTEPVAPQPLTEENLALLEGTLASKSVASTVGPFDYERQEIILRCNNIEKNPKEVLKKAIGKEILKDAEKIVHSTPLSAMKDKEVDRFLKTRENKKFSNAATFVYAIWPIIVGESRQIPAPENDADETVLQEHEGVFLKEWDDDGLYFSVREPFAAKSVPIRDKAYGKSMEKLLEKVPGLPTPQPDLTYGLELDAFILTEQCISATLDTIANLSHNIHYPFFILEYRSDQGRHIAGAELQACRGGAALVFAMRKSRVAAGLENTNDKSDTGRMAFSMALDTHTASIFVHWAQGKALGDIKKPIYYMARVAQISLTKREDIPSLRACVYNILEWGCGERKSYIKSLLLKIEAQAAAEKKLARSQSGSGESNKATESEDESDEKDGS